MIYGKVCVWGGGAPSRVVGWQILTGFIDINDSM